MKKYLVTYTEIYTGTIEVSAKTNEEAMELVQDLIETKQLVPSETYDGHEITVDFAEEVKNKWKIGQEMLTVFIKL